jgi:hypothetical protein
MAGSEILFSHAMLESGSQPRECMVTPPFLSEKDWRSLLRDIHSGGQVIPVIGPDLVTVQDRNTGNNVPLYTWLAPRLATALSL